MTVRELDFNRQNIIRNIGPIRLVADARLLVLKKPNVKLLKTLVKYCFIDLLTNLFDL